MQLSSSSSLNAKLYKAFCKNRFSVTLWQSSTSDSRALLLTLQYNFNTSKNRYKGKGAGNEELNRF